MAERIGPTGSTGPGRALRVAIIAAVLLAGFCGLLPAQFADPFVRHDDWPAVLPAPELYYWKTLAKGRWVTWAWTLRPWPSDPTTLWWLYMGLWCTAASAIGVGLFRDDAGPWRALVTAATVAAMPQAADISTWYAATTPALAGVCAAALVGCLAGPRTVLWAVAGLVPLTLMAHSSYPLLILMTAALASDWRAMPRAWVLLPGVFVASLAAGIAAILLLNGAVHGVFRIHAEVWVEEGRAAADGASGRLAFAGVWLAQALRLMGGGLPALGPALLALAGLALALALARAPRRAAPVLSASALAFGLGLAPVLVDGIAVPFRATGHLWLIATGALALAVSVLAVRVRQAVFLVALGAAALASGQLWHGLYNGFLPPYQAMSRSLAERAIAAAQGPLARVLVVGQVHGLPDTEPLQYGYGLGFRLQALTGAKAALCTPQTTDLLRGAGADDAALARELAGWDAHRAGEADVCASHRAALMALPGYPAEGHAAAIAPGIVGLRLPDRRRADVPP